MGRFVQILFLTITFLFTIFVQIDSHIDNVLRTIVKHSMQPNCNCSPHDCCSKWGYCGRSDAYCGSGCQSGPCKVSQKSIQTNFEITNEIFSCIFPNIDSDLRNHRFQGFQEAMNETKWSPRSSSEAAVFLAHVSHETDGLKTLVEYCSQQNTCNNYQTSWCSIQAHENQTYYGRGWFQLSYPCNYYYAGKALGIDLLNNPDLVSQNDRLAASTAIWYFIETGMNQLAQKNDFGSTTRKLNEYECCGRTGFHMQAARIQTYHRVRQCFNLPEITTNLIC